MPARATRPQPKPKQPTVVVIAGPNGAGKSTAAPYLLKDALGILEFVNADQIAAGLSLSAYAPETVAFEAGRIMLQCFRALAATQVNFAFESTLSSRTFAVFMARCKAQGYQVLLRGLAQRRAGHTARCTARPTGQAQRSARRYSPSLSASHL